MIYLDHNATSPMLPAVFEAMRPWMQGMSGNASSLHSAGRKARAAIEAARHDIGELIGGDPEGVHFCSGGTEADVWALRATFEGDLQDRPTLVISAVEHPAIRNTANALSERGVSVRVIDVDALGCLRPCPLDKDVRLVAVMAANNETGNLYDIGAWSQRARAVGAMVHSDLVQAAGKVEVNVHDWGVTTAALSAHKIGGPQGIGALWIKPGRKLTSLMTGGGQERGKRSGTENVAGIVGFATAAKIAKQRLQQEAKRLAGLRDKMAHDVMDAVPGSMQLGDVSNRLPNTLALAFSKLAGEAVVMRLDAMGIAISTGSACSSGSKDPSKVLLAMGLSKWQVKGAIRLSLGPTTTAEQVAEATAAVIETVRSLQALSHTV